MTFRVRRAAVGVAGAAAGAALVASAFFRVVRQAGGVSLVARFDLRGFAAALPGQLHWLVPFMGLTAVLSFARAAVWRAVLPPPAAPCTDTWHATALGALFHNTVPGKGGPAVAALLLSRFTSRPFGAALSSQLLAKLLELAATVALAGTAALLRGGAEGGGADASGLWRGAAAGGAAVAVGLALALALRRAAPGAAARLAGRPRLALFARAAGEGLAAVRHPSRLLTALLLATLPPLASSAAYALPLAAAGVSAPFTGGALVLAAVTLGQLTPGLPIGAGVHYALASWAARALGVPARDAAALAMLTHAGGVLAAIAVGLASAAARRGALRDLWAERRRWSTG